jgi:hypothetical protein
MTDVTADETVDRVIRSLEANSANFAEQRRAARGATFRKLMVVGFVFVAGVVAGLLIR